MDKAERDAREIYQRWAYEGFRPESTDDLVTGIAAALRQRDAELVQAREEIARLTAQAQVETHRYLSLEAKADQMRADLGQAREERDAALEALRGVVSVADRKTKEFDAARAVLARLPQAAGRAQARVGERLSPMARAILAKVTCTKCGANYGLCDCWSSCACGWSYERGTKCRNPVHRRSHAARRRKEKPRG